MRLPLAALLAITTLMTTSAVRAEPDAVEQCKAFFHKFQTCIDGLKGEDQDEARIYLKTLRGTLGMSDDLNQGDPTMIGILCGVMREEIKKEPSVQKYNCAW